MKGQVEFLKCDFATVCTFSFLKDSLSSIRTIADQRREKENVRQKIKVSESRRNLELFLFLSRLNKVRRDAYKKNKT